MVGSETMFVEWFSSAASMPVLGLSSAEAPIAWGFGIITVVGLAVLYVFDSRRSKQIAALQTTQARANAFAEQHAERDQKAYEQHVTLNQLTADKIRLENQYLQMQLRIGQLEVEAREHNEEYHELMRQKTQLEIQSLKLHIREQTKRLDDFSGYDQD